MTILALEFSSARRSAAVLVGGRLCGSADGPPLERATGAFALIEAALRQAGLRPEAIECLVVGLGPGSYTGIRVAVAVAQGWQLARGVELLRLSSADAVAAQARQEGRRGRLHVALDPQRNEAALAAYELGEVDCRQVSPLRLATRAEIESLAAAGASVAGPVVPAWGLPGVALFPSAIHLGSLAAGRADFIPGEDLAPIYLRAAEFVKAPPHRPT